MREEWDKRIERLKEDVKLAFGEDVTSDGTKDDIVSPDLKVRHQKSGIRYTVVSVGPRDVILKTPEGKTFILGKNDLEREYTLAWYFLILICNHNGQEQHTFWH